MYHLVCSMDKLSLVPASISAVWLNMSWDGAFGGMDVASPRTGFRLIVPPTGRALPDIIMFVFMRGWILLPTSFNGRMPLGLQPPGNFFAAVAAGILLGGAWFARDIARTASSKFQSNVYILSDYPNKP